MNVYKVYGLRVYLVVYVLSFVLSCVLGPLRGHSLRVSAFGGFALGPLNLILIWLLRPPGPPRGALPPDQAFEKWSPGEPAVSRRAESGGTSSARYGVHPGDPGEPPGAFQPDGPRG